MVCVAGCDKGVLPGMGVALCATVCALAAYCEG